MLPLNHLLSTHSCAGTVQWPGTSLVISVCGLYCMVLPVTCKFLSPAGLLSTSQSFLSATCLLSPCGCLSAATKPQSFPLIVVEPRPPCLRTPSRAVGLTQTCLTPRAKHKLWTEPCLPLQRAPLPLPGLREHTHDSGPLGRVRPRNRLPVVWAGNSEAQKPGRSPTHSLFRPGSGLVQQMLFLPLSSTVREAWSKSPLSQPRDSAAPLPTATPVHFTPAGLGEL